jgi:hypothetical protein
LLQGTESGEPVRVRAWRDGQGVAGKKLLAAGCFIRAFEIRFGYPLVHLLL